MKLTGAELGAWAEKFYGECGLPMTWERLRSDADMSRITLAVQRRKDTVDPSVICRVARRHGRNPLRELNTIPRFEGRLVPGEPARSFEVVASLHPGWALQELASRVTETVLHVPENFGGRLTDFTYRFAAWVDIAGAPDGRDQLGEILGASPATVARRLRSEITFSLGELLKVSGSLGLSATWGAILGGHITVEEAGIREGVQGRAMNKMSDDDLIQVVAKQSVYTERALGDIRSTRDAEEFLGSAES